jgi:hypothetical protein
VGASGTRHEVHRRRHPTDIVNPSRSRKRTAAGRPTYGRPQHRRLIPFPRLRPEARLPLATPPPVTMAGSSATPAMQDHEGITPVPPSPLHLSRTRLVLDLLDFFGLHHEVDDPRLK